MLDDGFEGDLDLDLEYVAPVLSGRGRPCKICSGHPDDRQKALFDLMNGDPFDNVAGRLGIARSGLLNHFDRHEAPICRAFREWNMREKKKRKSLATASIESALAPVSLEERDAVQGVKAGMERAQIAIEAAMRALEADGDSRGLVAASKAWVTVAEALEKMKDRGGAEKANQVELIEIYDILLRKLRTPGGIEELEYSLGSWIDNA